MNGSTFTWFTAPSDKFEWSIVPKRDGASAYLQLRLIIDRKNEQRNRLAIRTWISARVMEQARAGDYRDFLYCVLDGVGCIINRIGANPRLFPFTTEMLKGIEPWRFK